MVLLGCQAQGAPQGWAHHSLEPGWGRTPGLAPAPRPQLSQANMAGKGAGTGMTYYLPDTKPSNLFHIQDNPGQFR